MGLTAERSLRSTAEEILLGSSPVLARAKRRLGGSPLFSAFRFEGFNDRWDWSPTRGTARGTAEQESSLAARMDSAGRRIAAWPLPEGWRWVEALCSPRAAGAAAHVPSPDGFGGDSGWWRWSFASHGLSGSGILDELGLEQVRNRRTARRLRRAAEDLSEGRALVVGLAGVEDAGGLSAHERLDWLSRLAPKLSTAVPPGASRPAFGGDPSAPRVAILSRSGPIASVCTHALQTWGPRGRCLLFHGRILHLPLD